jgi:hypothetical protein
MFDAMGRRYSKLPSELLREADSFDLMVMDVASTYEAFENAKSNNKNMDQFYEKDNLTDHFNKVTGRDI